MVTLVYTYMPMILRHHNMLEVTIIWPQNLFLQIKTWDDFLTQGNDVNCFQHFPTVCSNLW